ncbi:transmembrane protein 192 [Bombina bombina]|uniref:transmembrane protein 192 n=1 Tax=Bombina bombina TaxID=8345 RepID=UPI00235AF479|nr:transmembrane protein 192 [Bombina bombina]
MAGNQRLLLDSSGELTQSADDDCLLDAPLLPSQKLMSEIKPSFQPVPTVCVSILLQLVQVSYVSLSFVAALFCAKETEKCKPYIKPFQIQTIVIISKVILWMFHVLNERFLQYHHRKVKSRGYLNLYRSTEYLKRFPLLIQSTGNAALLVIISAQDSFDGSGYLYIYLILSVLGLELIISLVFVTIYTVRIQRFNSTMPSPDIIEEEKIHAYERHVNPEIGFRERASLEDVVEKQGDVIEYLQHHNALLSKQLLAATPQQS